MKVVNIAVATLNHSLPSLNSCVQLFSVCTEATRLKVNWQKFRDLLAYRLRFASVRDC